MSEEMLDIISDDDKVIGHASYSKVHSEKLMHRVSVGIVINDAGEVLLQLRSKNKSVYPLRWSFSMGGHVSHGESYEEALVREAKEEIGIVILFGDLILKGMGTVKEKSGGKVIYTVFEVPYDDPIEERTEEVDAVQFVNFSTLRKLVDEEKEKLDPHMVEAMKKYYQKELGLTA